MLPTLRTALLLSLYGASAVPRRQEPALNVITPTSVGAASTLLNPEPLATPPPVVGSSTSADDRQTPVVANAKTPDPPNTHDPSTLAAPIELAVFRPGVPATLPPSAPHTLATVSRVEHASGKSTFVARSYDGRPWEGVGPQPLEVYCDPDGDCEAPIPPSSSGTDYRLDVKTSTHSATATADKTAA